MATATNTIYGPLRRGSKGASVTLLQLSLNRRVVPPPRLSADGDFGAATDRAVRVFQTSNRLTVDGVVGLRTATALGLAYQGASPGSGSGAQPPAPHSGGSSAAGGGGGGGGGGGQVPAPQAPPRTPPTPNPQITRIKSYFPYRSSWSFSSSAGVAASVQMISGGGGKLWLQNGSKDSGMLYFGGVGGCVSMPLPSLTWSTKDMWSTGIGCLLTRTTEALEFSDLQGVAVVASLGAAAQLFDDGGSLNGSIYFLGISAWQAPLLIGPQGLFVAAQNATAMGMMAGSLNGFDAGGASMWIGGAA